MIQLSSDHGPWLTTLSKEAPGLGYRILSLGEKKEAQMKPSVCHKH